MAKPTATAAVPPMIASISRLMSRLKRMTEEIVAKKTPKRKNAENF